MNVTRTDNVRRVARTLWKSLHTFHKNKSTQTPNGWKLPEAWGLGMVPMRATTRPNLTWDKHLTYNPGQTSFGQYCNIHIVVSLLPVSLLKQCIIFEIFLQFSLPPPYT